MNGRLAARVLLAATTLLATLALLEAGLRIAGIDYSPMRVEDQHDDRTQHIFDGESFVYDPVLIWRPRPASGVFNRQGYRGAELTGAPAPGALRVVTVGDSNTLGWQGEDGAHWPGDLERLLRADDDRGRVVNAAVWGYTSHQGIARLAQALTLDPDLVTISFGSNDAHPVAVPDSAYSGNAIRPTAWKRAVGRLRLGRLALGAWTAAVTHRASGDAMTQRVELDDYRANLRRMVAMARQAGAQPVLLTRPYLDSVPEPPRWKALAPRYNLATVEVADAEGVPVVDFYSLFKAREELFADESHFTAEGHRLAAEILHRRLRPYLDRQAARVGG